MSTINLIVFLNFQFLLIHAFDPVSFNAIRGTLNDNYISYTGLLVNNNAHFNTLYGFFKCTSPGLYQFNFNVLTHPGKDLRVNLRINKFTVLSSYGGGRNPVSVSGSSLLQLAKDDIVYLFVDKGEINESLQLSHVFTSFSGVQITEKKSGLLSSIVARSESPHNEDPAFDFYEYLEPDRRDRIFDIVESEK